MARPEIDRGKLFVIIASSILICILAVIVIFAFLSPAQPEAVVSGMLQSFAQQDIEQLETFISDSALQIILNDRSNEDSRWLTYWRNGEDLFYDFRVAEVDINGDEAVVLVYFGPGLILDEEFVLNKKNKHWQVVGFNN